MGNSTILRNVKTDICRIIMNTWDEVTASSSTNNDTNIINQMPSVKEPTSSTSNAEDHNDDNIEIVYVYE